jgi:hypothetical protein
VVPGDALGTHAAELGGQPGPELLQTHVFDGSAPRPGPEPGIRSYAGGVFPTTGSATWDLVLEIGIALCLLVSLVLLYRNYRGR